MGSKEFSDQTTVTHENVMRPPRGDAQSTNPCPSCVRQNCEYVFLLVVCYIRDISIKSVWRQENESFFVYTL